MNSPLRGATPGEIADRYRGGSSISLELCYKIGATERCPRENDSRSERERFRSSQNGRVNAEKSGHN